MQHNPRYGVLRFVYIILISTNAPLKRPVILILFWGYRNYSSEISRDKILVLCSERLHATTRSWRRGMGWKAYFYRLLHLNVDIYHKNNWPYISRCFATLKNQLYGCGVHGISSMCFAVNDGLISQWIILIPYTHASATNNKKLFMGLVCCNLRSTTKLLWHDHNDRSFTAELLVMAQELCIRFAGLYLWVFSNYVPMCFTHIIHGYFTSTGAIVFAREATLKNMGELNALRESTMII